MIFDGALGGSDMRFIAPIHCPPLDPLGPDQSSGNQYPHVFAEGGGAHTELIGDQHAAHPVLDQVAIYLRREMRARVAQPLQYLESSLVCQCAQNVHENHFATLPIDEFMSSCFAMDDSITDQEVTITRERIAAAERVIRPYVRRTPILEVDAAEFGLAPCPLIFKLEQLQHSGSFKARGAFANLLLREVPEAGVVAASGGNHGVAVAYAARRLGVPATIFVPGIASPAKLERIRSYGAELVVGGELYADALAASEAHVAATGAMPVMLSISRRPCSVRGRWAGVGGGRTRPGHRAGGGWWRRPDWRYRGVVRGQGQGRCRGARKRTDTACRLRGGRTGGCAGGGYCRGQSGAEACRPTDVSDRPSPCGARSRVGDGRRYPGGAGGALVGAPSRGGAGECRGIRRAAFRPLPASRKSASPCWSVEPTPRPCASMSDARRNCPPAPAGDLSSARAKVATFARNPFSQTRSDVMATAKPQ